MTPSGDACAVSPDRLRMFTGASSPPLQYVTTFPAARHHRRCAANIDLEHSCLADPHNCHAAASTATGGGLVVLPPQYRPVTGIRAHPLRQVSLVPSTGSRTTAIAYTSSRPGRSSLKGRCQAQPFESGVNQDKVGARRIDGRDGPAALPLVNAIGLAFDSYGDVIGETVIVTPILAEEAHANLHRVARRLGGFPDERAAHGKGRVRRAAASASLRFSIRAIALATA